MKSSTILLLCTLFFLCFFIAVKGALEPTLIAASNRATVQTASFSSSLFAVGNKKHHRHESPGFQFEVIKSNCAGSGSTYTVDISNPNLYSYLWEANGRHAGHGISTYCLCGDYVKVRVMRLSDGLQVFKTLRLQNCWVKNAPEAAMD